LTPAAHFSFQSNKNESSAELFFSVILLVRTTQANFSQAGSKNKTVTICWIVSNYFSRLHNSGDARIENAKTWARPWLTYFSQERSSPGLNNFLRLSVCPFQANFCQSSSKNKTVQKISIFQLFFLLDGFSKNVGNSRIEKGRNLSGATMAYVFQPGAINFHSVDSSCSINANMLLFTLFSVKLE